MEALHTLEPLNEEPPPAGGGSFLDQLRAEIHRNVQAETIEIPIPGLEGVEVVARYQWLDVAKTKPIGEKIAAAKKLDDSDRILFASTDLLIASCIGLCARQPGDTLFEPLDPDGNGPVGYDARLAETLGLEAGSARELVRSLFRGNDYAIVQHSQLLQRWMADTTFDVHRALLGAE